MLFGHLLEHLVAVGTLRVNDADGHRYVFSGEPGASVTIRLHDRALGRKLFLNPTAHIGR